MKNKIKVYRAMHDLTQEDLAQAIGVTRRRSLPLRKESMSLHWIWRSGFHVTSR